MRYPHILIAAQGNKFFSESAAEDRIAHPAFKERAEKEWKWWLLGLVSFLIGEAIHNFIVAAFPVASSACYGFHGRALNTRASLMQAKER